MKRFTSLLLLPLLLLSPPASAESMREDQKIIHILNRFSFGIAPGNIERVNAVGIEAYIQSQLNASSISEPIELKKKIAGFKSLSMTPGQLLETYGNKPGVKTLSEEEKREMKKERRQEVHAVLAEAIDAKILRATLSPRQLEEVMVNFWFNHFNVFSGKGIGVQFLIGNYEENAIRPYVFGEFRDLLGATAKHPAMLIYLDNILNTAPKSPGARGKLTGLNENYARELMELHTLGVDGGYTQKDVTELARILTGWGVTRPNGARKKGAIRNAPAGFYFDEKRHDFGDKVLLGHSIKGRGRAEVDEALDILARHPSTAKYLSFKLAQYFVSDKPPETLVLKMAGAFTKTDGNIREVLQTLFNSAEFWDSSVYNAKFKTPFHYVVSALRSTDVKPDRIAMIDRVLKSWGMPLYGCLTPDGYEYTQDKWMNADALVKRASFATQLTAGGGQKNPNAGNKKLNVDASVLRTTLGNLITPKTDEVLASSEDRLDAALLLGSPEFMRY